MCVDVLYLCCCRGDMIVQPTSFDETESGGVGGIVGSDESHHKALMGLRAWMHL